MAESRAVAGGEEVILAALMGAAPAVERAVRRVEGVGAAARARCTLPRAVPRPDHQCRSTNSLCGTTLPQLQARSR